MKLSKPKVYLIIMAIFYYVTEGQVASNNFFNVAIASKNAFNAFIFTWTSYAWVSLCRSISWTVPKVVKWRSGKKIPLPTLPFLNSNYQLTKINV